MIAGDNVGIGYHCQKPAGQIDDAIDAERCDRENR